MDADTRLGAFIRSRREELGLHRTDLANALGVNYRTFQRLEEGEAPVSLTLAAKLSTALTVPISHLLSLVSGEDALHLASREWVWSLAAYSNDDPTREGLLETPVRVARAYQEFFRPPVVKATAFTNTAYDQMVLVRGITYFSFCEHHLLPFFGKAVIGYVPGTTVLGLSKLARIVQEYAGRLQLQERLTEQVADRIVQESDPKGVGVLVQGQHLCMSGRGVRQVLSDTVTSALRGVFLQEGPTRSEFLALARGSL